MTDLVLGLTVLLLGVVSLGYRRRSLHASRKAQHWFDVATELEGDVQHYRMLLGWTKRSGVVAGTSANPILLHRGYDSHLGDTARWSTLRDLGVR